ERRDREERAAQPQGQITQPQADDAGDDAADEDQQRNRYLIGLVEEHRGVGAKREKSGRTEVHIAAIAAENVPGGRQNHKLQDDVAGEKQVIVRDQLGEREHDHGGGDRDKKENP